MRHFCSIHRPDIGASSGVNTFVVGYHLPVPLLLLQPRQVTESVALLDMIFGFSDLVTVSPLSFCRPEVTTGGPLTIRGGRHPVVGAVQECKFVPNDTYMRRASVAYAVRGERWPSTLSTACKYRWKRPDVCVP